MIHIYIFNEETIASEYGIGTYVNHLIECFQYEHNVSLHNVITNSKKEEYEIIKSNLYSTIYIPYVYDLKHEKNRIKYYRNIAYLLLNNIKISDDDQLIFHFNYPIYTFIFQIKKIFPNALIVYTIHIDFVYMFHTHKKGTELNKKNEEEFNNDIIRIYDSVDYIICLSQFIKDWLINRYDISEKKISLIPNGLIDEYFLLKTEK